MKVPPAWFFDGMVRVANAVFALRLRLLPPPYAAIELGTMSWIALALAAFCKLGLAQALSKRPCSPAELAASGYGKETMLFRLLRSLSGYGVVRYAGQGRFALGRIGLGLCGPDSAAPAILYANAPWHLDAYSNLAQTVQTGRPGFVISEERSLFDRLASDAESGKLFDSAMEALSVLSAGAFARAYNFRGASTLVDVGGGTGALLEAVLCRFPHLRGTIVEVSGVAERARRKQREAALQARINVVAGDIFHDTPPSADIYVLSHVLHDWDDEFCARILANVRRAMTPSARLLIYEIVASPPNNRWSQDRISDLEMMAMLPGRERTRKEFEVLLAGQGLRITRVVRTAAAESIIESSPS